MPVGAPGWAEEVGQRVRLVNGSRFQTAEIRLSPAELGPLRIQVAVEDGATSVTFIAQHALTRDAIEQALPRLREMLADNGLTLAQTSVGGESVPQGQRDAGRAVPADGYRAPGAAEADAGTDGPARRREPAGLVDTFA